MERYIIKKCPKRRPWSPDELMAIQRLLDIDCPPRMHQHQRNSILWILRDTEKNTLVGTASLSPSYHMDPTKAFGVVYGVHLCETLDEKDLRKKLRVMIMKRIVAYSRQKGLRYIQMESAPGEKKASDLYPHFGFHRVAQSSNAVHGIHIDRLDIFAESY